MSKDVLRAFSLAKLRVIRYNLRGNKGGEGNPMRFATIGSNFIVENFLAGARLHREFVLEAVYSRSPEKVRRLCGAWGAKRAYTSLEALAADPDIDAVYIASPNVCHAAQAIQMMRAGKHVLCEKPMALCSEELTRMYAAADENGVVLLEAMRSAHSPATAAVRQALGGLGTLRHADLSYCQYSSRYPRWQQGVVLNAFDPSMGGGALMDIGVYCVHMMVMLFGPPRAIEAKGAFLPGSIDAVGSVHAQYGGFTVDLRYSKLYDSHQLCEVAGEEGAVAFGPVGAPRMVRLLPRGGRPRELGLEILPQDMYYEVRDFIALARGALGGAPYRRWSCQAMQVLDAVRAQVKIDFCGHMPGEGWSLL